MYNRNYGILFGRQRTIMGASLGTPETGEGGNRPAKVVDCHGAGRRTLKQTYTVRAVNLLWTTITRIANNDLLPIWSVGSVLQGEQASYPASTARYVLLPVRRYTRGDVCYQP